MILAPFRLATLQRRQHPRVVGAGVLAGQDQISLALWTSCNVTLALPMPMVSASATLVDSWHMLEQSGRLLVPKARTNSW